MHLSRRTRSQHGGTTQRCAHTRAAASGAQPPRGAARMRRMRAPRRSSKQCSSSGAAPRQCCGSPLTASSALLAVRWRLARLHSNPTEIWCAPHGRGRPGCAHGIERAPCLLLVHVHHSLYILINVLTCLLIISISYQNDL